MFLKIVSYKDQIKQTDNRLEITPVASNPKDPALDVKIPYVVSEKNPCILPTENEIEQALIDADKKVGRE